MKRIGLLMLVFSLCGIANGSDAIQTEDLERLFTTCRHVGGPTVFDDLLALANGTGASNEEIASCLMEIVKDGISEEAEARQRFCAECAISALGRFGGGNERSFLLELMRTTSDKNLRQAALRACIRMEPDKFDDVVREVASDERFDSYAKFGAFEEAFRVGKAGNSQLRERVKQVLSDWGEKTRGCVSLECLDSWLAELEKL